MIMKFCHISSGELCLLRSAALTSSTTGITNTAMTSAVRYSRADTGVKRNASATGLTSTTVTIISALNSNESHRTLFCPSIRKMLPRSDRILKL